MLVVIAYDVNTSEPAGARRLRKVAKLCVNKGQRVQKSVFECLLTSAEYVEFKSELSRIIKADEDSLRFYKLGNKYEKAIEFIGRSEVYEPEGFLAL